MELAEVTEVAEVEVLEVGEVVELGELVKFQSTVVKPDGKPKYKLTSEDNAVLNLPAMKFKSLHNSFKDLDRQEDLLNSMAKNVRILELVVITNISY